MAKNAKKKDFEKKGLTTGQIIAICVAAAVLIAGIAVVVYFYLKPKPQATVSATTGNIEIIDEQNLVLSFTTPYMDEDSAFYVENNKGFYISYTDEKTNKEVKITGQITETPTFSSNKTDSLAYGNLSVKIKLDQKLKPSDTALLKAVLEADSISCKKQKYSTPEIITHFRFSLDEAGLFEVKVEKFPYAKAIVPSDVEAKLSKEKGKAYCTITARVDGVTDYNKEGIQNLSTLVYFMYKNSEGVTYRLPQPQKGIDFSVSNGKIVFKYVVEEKDLIPGCEYELSIPKGLFINEDMSVVNDEYTCKFTYVE
ncbi:MAG: hypothetical protein E7536_10665 [Ruminococcaceae bacterium]|nr:hypothetical protein [Oscillospiraceae bacterium]